MIIKLLDSAEDDLVEGYHFYERKAEGLGNYFLDSLFQISLPSIFMQASIHNISDIIVFWRKDFHLPFTIS